MTCSRITNIPWNQLCQKMHLNWNKRSIVNLQGLYHVSTLTFNFKMNYRSSWRTRHSLSQNLGGLNEKTLVCWRNLMLDQVYIVLETWRKVCHLHLDQKFQVLIQVVTCKRDCRQQWIYLQKASENERS